MPPDMMRDNNSEAENEIRDIMFYCNLCTRSIGLSFVDRPRNLTEQLRMKAWFIICCFSLFLLCLGEMSYIVRLLICSKTVVEEIVAVLHLFLYACIGFLKLVTLWYKRNVFKKLINNLVNIWPKDNDNEEDFMKSSSIASVHRLQFWYMSVTIFGLTFYCVTPMALTLYNILRGATTEPAFIWFVEYPFEKRDPVNSKIAYIFEVFAGYSCVGSMLGAEIFFTGMASTISILLRILQSKIRKLILSPQRDSRNFQLTESVLRTRDDRYYYDEIVSVIKIHQKLISYSVHLEDAFSLVNLFNVLLSSVMICCVVFDIVFLDPWMDVSNKFFLGAVLTEIGIMCWYADEIYRSSLSVADAVYESAWYEATPRCRRALLLMLLRSQKPICFTAYKFSNITLTTYSSILTTSYSYFALLYTMFRRNF